MIFRFGILKCKNGNDIRGNHNRLLGIQYVFLLKIQITLAVDPNV